MTAASDLGDRRNPGLRERKKAKTRAAIQRHALRLFQEKGYAATTVDQIAEAAEISPSTFFRYFPTKEDVVLLDGWDPMFVASVLAQPPEMGPVAAIRAAIREVVARMSAEEWEAERGRQELVRMVPELRTRLLQQYVDAIDLLAGAIAERAGLPADDFAVRAMAGAVIGVSLAAVPHVLGGTHDLIDYDRVDEALALLEAGLPLPGKA
ncbi:acyl-CoA-like ligand-binding transcription factor [Phytohabitans sp. LJ34]|uniref:acyl-CoA-like ligand-binding transcription factor n=1 Tax=Phytohabitans sp. LJ34 TaxID=3452217 RepID=UPI003F890CD6